MKMKTTPVLRALTILFAMWVWAPRTADAQVVATFRWHLQPFCNVLTLRVTQTGPAFTLDGFDDLCGASVRAAVTGTALQNPDGSIGIGLTVIQPQHAEPLQIVATVNLATISGNWRDNAGRTGQFLFNPASALGQPRPVSEAVHWLNVRADATVRSTSNALTGTVVLRPSGEPVGAYCIRFPAGAVVRSEVAVGSLQEDIVGAVGFINVTTTFGSVCNQSNSDITVQTYNNLGAPTNRAFMLMLPRQ